MITSYKNLGRTAKVITSFNPLSGKTTSAYGDFMERITEEDLKNDGYYKILISEYPMDTLSEVIKDKFEHIDFEKLLKAHERKGVVFTGLGMKEVTGFLLTIFTLILKTVPQKVVEETFHIAFEDFEIALFWSMVFLIGYAFVILLPSWRKISNARGVYNQVGNILKYIVIKYY
jgi:hypothetical protein